MKNINENYIFNQMTYSYKKKSATLAKKKIRKKWKRRDEDDDRGMWD